MITVDLGDAPISLAEFLDDASAPSHGAQTIFTGRVRNHNMGKKVRGVSYDAFFPLTKTTLEQIAVEAQTKWGPDIHIRIAHRFGRLDIGDLSVAILVSSRHRDESFSAARYIIEELKTRAAIWKREHYEDGDSKWLQGHALCGHHHEPDQTL